MSFIEIISNAFHVFTTTIVVLFPLYNPIGTAIIISPHLEPLPRNKQKIACIHICIYTLFLSIVFLLLGKVVLAILGLKVSVVTFAGGIFIASIGWKILNSDDTPVDKNDHSSPQNQPNYNINNYLFSPLTFPLTIGGGVMAVLIALGSRSFVTDRGVDIIISIVANILGIVACCIIIFICYYYLAGNIKKLGSKATAVINKIMAFFVFAVGITVAIEGLQEIVSPYLPK